MAGEVVGREIETRQRMRFGRSAIRLLVVLLLVGAGVALYRLVMSDNGHERGVSTPGAIPITAGVATTRDMPIWLSGIGSVQPINVVTVKVVGTVRSSNRSNARGVNTRTGLVRRRDVSFLNI